MRRLSMFIALLALLFTQSATADSPTVLPPNIMCVWAIDTDDWKETKAVVTTTNRASDLANALGIPVGQLTYGTASSVTSSNPSQIVTCDCVPSPALATYWGIISANSQDDYPQFAFEQANNR